MSNLRPPSIPLSAEAIAKTLDAPLPRAQTDLLEFVAGTPKGAAILIERFRR